MGDILLLVLVLCVVDLCDELVEISLVDFQYIRVERAMSSPCTRVLLRVQESQAKLAGLRSALHTLAPTRDTYFFLTSPKSILSFKPITRYVRSCSSKHARIKGKLFFLLRLLILTPVMRSRSTSVSQRPRRNRTPGCVNRARSGPCLSCTMR